MLNSSRLMKRIAVGLGLCAVLATTPTVHSDHGGLYPADRIRAQYPGELGRLAERMTEARYRSSNVFRNSRQFSGLHNPYRASRHYQRELALSYDGFHVRTHVHRPTNEVLVDHRLRFGSRRFAQYPLLSHGIGHRGHVSHAPICSVENSQLASVPGVIEREILDDRYERAQQRLRDRQASDSSAPTTSPVSMQSPQREPTEEPVMQRIQQEDGSTKWIMVSVPKDELDAYIAEADDDNVVEGGEAESGEAQADDDDHAVAADTRADAASQDDASDE